MATNPRIGPFPFGMNNRAPDFKLKLPEQAGHFLRDAFNVDVTQEGSVKTRAGYTLSTAGTDCHSLWSPISGAFALYVDNGALLRLNADMTTASVATGFGLMGPVRYAEVNEAIYFTDGIRYGSYHPTAGPTPAWGAGAPFIDDQQLAPMPAGSNIAFQGARLLVAVGNALIYSEPFTPHLRDVAKGFELFPAPITCIASVEDGVVVTADKTYFIAGGFPAKGLQSVAEYGAPVQQAAYAPNGSASWMSHRGIMTCSRKGEVTNLQEERVALKAEGEAAMLWRDADGMRTIIAALSEPSSTGAGVGSYAQARIIRKE